jgi:integrase
MDFVFSSERGGPLHASNYRRRILIPAFEAAGIKLAPGLCFHVFRRSCGTWLGAADGGGMDLPDVAAWLGHSDATVTLRHYMKASELEAPAALDALVSAEARG